MAACNCKLVSSVFLGILSFFYFIIGAAIAAVSLILLLVPALIGEKVVGFTFIVILLFIVAGFLLILSSIFGCVIACKRPFCLIILFIVVIVTSLALQIAGSIQFRAENEKSALSISRAKEATPRNRFYDLMPDYWTNIDHRVNIDNRQNIFQCCGFESYTDWKESRVKPDDATMEGKTVLGYVPKSCCKTSTCEDADDLYQSGCRVRLEKVIKTYKMVLNVSHIIAGVFLGIQVIGALLAILIAVLVRRERGDDRGQFIPMSNQTSL